MSNWIVTAIGREHYFSGAAADKPDNVPGLREIAHSLAQINRYTGHARRPYSVAEHSLLVANMAEEAGSSTQVVLAALMHDAHECLVGDVASPVKAELGAVWAEFEDRQQTRVLQHYGLLEVFQANHRSIKHWDLQALATERLDLLPWSNVHHTPWPSLDTYGKRVYRVPVNLNEAWRIQNTWETWAHIFEQRALRVMAKLRDEARGVAA